MAVRATFIGYKSTQVEGVKVLAGQTITVDVQLEQTAVEIQEITVVTETQPLVPRDEVTTKQRVDGQFADALPVDRINDVLELQPGVIADNNGNLSIRGGRNNEAATYVDGVPVQAGYRGDRFAGSAGTPLAIGTNAFEEASVTTGSSSAEFGNAKSGIISIVTKTGGSEYNGSFSLRDGRAVRREPLRRVQPVRGQLQRPAGRPPHLRPERHARGPQGRSRKASAAQNVPIFLPAGIDTTISQVSALDDPATPEDESATADTTQVPVYNYAISRGKCDAFAERGRRRRQRRRRRVHQPDPEQLRAGLQRRPPAGDRHDALHRVGQAELHLRHRLAAVAQPGHQPEPGPHLPVHHRATSTTCRSRRPIAASPTGTTSRRSTGPRTCPRAAERALALDVALSYQQDRTINGPLTTESDLSHP